MSLICTHCNEPIINELKAIMVTADGDFVCNKECEEGWKKARDHLLNDILPDENATEAWLLGLID